MDDARVVGSYYFAREQASAPIAGWTTREGRGLRARRAVRLVQPLDLVGPATRQRPHRGTRRHHRPGVDRAAVRRVWRAPRGEGPDPDGIRAVQRHRLHTGRAEDVAAAAGP